MRKDFRIFIAPGHGGLAFGWDGVTPVTMTVSYATKAPRGARYVHAVPEWAAKSPAFQAWYKRGYRTLTGTRAEILGALRAIAEAA